MTESTDHINEIKDTFIWEDEEVIHGIRVDLSGNANKNMLSGTLGIAGYVVGQAAMSKNRNSNVGFKPERFMVLGLTNKRIVFFGRSLFTDKPDDVIGSLAINDLKVVYFKKGLLHKLKFELTNGVTLAVECARKDMGQEFANKLYGMILESQIAPAIPPPDLPPPVPRVE